MRLVSNRYVTFMLYKLSILSLSADAGNGASLDGCSYIWCHKRGTTVTIKMGGVEIKLKVKTL